MPARPASWRTVRNRFNAITREFEAAAAPERAAREERIRAAEAAAREQRRAARAARPAPKPRAPKPSQAVAPCGHPTVATCAAGWRPYQPCGPCADALAADPACADHPSCNVAGSPPCVKRAS